MNKTGRAKEIKRLRNEFANEDVLAEKPTKKSILKEELNGSRKETNIKEDTGR